MLCHLIIVFVLPLIGGAGELGTFEDKHAHCLSVNRGDVLDAAAAAPPQLCGTGMAQVSVRGVGGRGSERLRAEASRLRRPTRGRVVLRAASSFLPAFSQSSAPILRPVRLLGGAATCGRVVSYLGSRRVVTGFRKVCVAPRRRRGRSSCLSCPRRAFRPD